MFFHLGFTGFDFKTKTLNIWNMSILNNELLALLFSSRKRVCLVAMVFLILFGAYCSTFKSDGSNSLDSKACNPFTRYQIRNLNSNFQIVNNECNNILENLTDGKWFMNEHYNETELQHLLFLQTKLRQHLDFPAKLWRSDGRCGTHEPIYHGSKFASICDPKGPSCCTNTDSGYCISGVLNNCKCKTCVDFAKFLFPSLSKWITNDKRYDRTVFLSCRFHD